MTTLRLGADVLHEVTGASRREWLLTDGRGGFAASTVLGLNTRREHGLLVVPLRSPNHRMVLLSRVEEAVSVDGVRYDLATNEYGGRVSTNGHKLAEEFLLDPLPTLTWEIEGRRLSKTVARLYTDPGVVIVYEYDGPEPLAIEVRPLLAYRELDVLQRENAVVRREVERKGADVIVRPYEGCPPLALRWTGAAWQDDAVWYRGFTYARDAEAGRPDREDLFSPGLFRAELRPGTASLLVAWASPGVPVATDLTVRLAAERRRLRALADAGEPNLAELRRAADVFVLRRGDLPPAILSAYPAGAVRGRDTLVALPGLLLATGRHEEARALLSDFAARVEAGSHPPEEGDASSRVDGVDVPLWWVVAIHRYVEATGDREFVRARLQGALVAVLEAHRTGGRPGLVIGADGMLVHSTSGATWMDALDPASPARTGQAVEVQALWYNALVIGSELARAAGQNARAGEWSAYASRVREGFLRAFWSDRYGYLADRVAPSGVADFTLRPSQLYAIGLPHALVPRDKAQRVIEAVHRSLLTPVGVKGLASDQGDHVARVEDILPPRAVWHARAAWPFLAVLYFEAAIRVHGEAAKPEAWRWIDGFAPRLFEAGLGQVPEAFEADPPHRPLGAIASARNVGEVLRLVTRLGRRPAVRRP